MEEKRKLRIGFVSNCPAGGKTGLARNMKAILPPLYNSDKYEIFFLAQGTLYDNDPSFQKLPFKCEGVLKNVDQNRFQQDPGYQRAVAYGNTAIQDFVLNNKLDCLVLSDDIWAFDNGAYLNTDWFNNMKGNVLPVITADSEPLLPQIVEWAEKVPNMKFWTSFAPRVLKDKDKDKFKHCDIIYGALKTEDFRPLPKFEKQALRKKFGIADDEKIIIYLGRNQLRKIFGSHIEGLAKFKKRNPDKKLRLLFHCSWSEQMGWPINQIREQNGLKPEDILTTYYCRHCGDWNVQPFQGEELNCPVCKKEKTRVTAGVGSTIDEQDLNKIYNLADGSASIFTSGAFEFTNAESMLAGIPLACPNYVCGEDFIDSGHVYQIRGTYTFEHNTGFKKFVPDIGSVCDFFEYIYNLPEQKRLEVTTKARKWAIDNFDAKNVVKKYEEFFDKCSPIDWEVYHNKKKEQKNVNAQVEDKSNDDDFILECYTKILNNPDVKSNDSGGFNHWQKFLAQPRDKGQLKNEMVNVFRNAAAQHNQKAQPPTTLESVLDKEDKERVLLVLKESLGDEYIITALLPEIKNKYPLASIYIACDPKYNEVFELNPYVKKCIPWNQELENEMAMTGAGGNKGSFNYFHNIGLTTQRSLNYLSSKY
jgi:glycosyltransferase involved in cell wall biosynthesis